jgi:hypothetical protein
MKKTHIIDILMVDNARKEARGFLIEWGISLSVVRLMGEHQELLLREFVSTAEEFFQV